MARSTILEPGSAAWALVLRLDHLTITGTYDIPGYKMKGQMLQGWQVNVAATILSALPFNAQDTTDDLSGTGINQDRWNILGDPGNLVTGTAAPVPCFGITGSKFAASGTGCTIVPAVANLPTQCLTAAGAAASNPAVPAANNAMGELGLLGCYFQNGTAIVPADDARELPAPMPTISLND